MMIFSISVIMLLLLEIFYDFTEEFSMLNIIYITLIIIPIISIMSIRFVAFIEIDNIRKIIQGVKIPDGTNGRGISYSGRHFIINFKDIKDIILLEENKTIKIVMNNGRETVLFFKMFSNKQYQNISKEILYCKVK